MNTIRGVTLDSLLEGTETVHSNGESFLLAVETLVQTNANVTYDVHRIFMINNLAVMELNNGEPFFEVEFPDNGGDLISHVDSNCKNELVVSGRVYPITRIVNCASVYNSKKLRLYPGDKPRIYLSYKFTLLQTDLRNRVRDTPLLLCDDLKYANGSIFV